MESLKHSAKEVRRRLADVAPFRAVALQLMRFVGQPDVPFARIIALLRSDAVLVAQLLRLANSPLLGCGNEIKTISHALAILGINRINALILTQAMKSLVDTRHSALTEACWRHNLATALFCESFAKLICLQSETCYIAGLIHDVGYLALIRAIPEYEEEMKRREAQKLEVLASERLLFGIDHCVAGRYLLEEWGCPAELQNVAGMHEDPCTAPEPDKNLIGFVNACSRMADLMGFRVFSSPADPQLAVIFSTFPAAVGEPLAEEFPHFADRVMDKMNRIELSLNV